MKEAFIKTDMGATMAVYLFGDVSQEALVICHGLGADHRQWIADAEHFSKDRFVVLLDLRGHGKSTYPEGASAADFTLQKLAKDVESVIDHLGINKFDFIGNSLGGLVGLELTKFIPEKMRSLLTCGTTYELHFPKLVVWMRWLMFKILSDKAIGKAVAKGATKCERARPLIREMYAKVNRPVMHWINQTIYDYDYLEVALNFKGRICLLKGTDDTDINKQLESTETLLASMPTAQIIDVVGAGHFTNLDQPETFRELVLKFLSKST